MPGTNQGRKARPARLKVLEGRSPGRDSGGRPLPATPEFRRLEPEKPDDLSPAASEHWDLIVPELMRLELTKAIDAGSLAQLCETHARWKLAQEALNRDGLYVTVHLSRGELEWTEERPNPAVAIVERASREYRSWAAEFGLTPSSESRLGKKEAGGDGQNPFGRPATVG